MRSYIILALAALLIGFGAFYPKDDFKEKEGMILHAVMNYLKVLHFAPQDIDDDFSKKAFANYLKALDGNKRFLIQDEIDSLNLYETEIDDQVHLRTFEFFEKSVALVESSYDRAERIYDEIIAHPFDFTAKEFIEFDSEKKEYANSESDLKEEWRKYLKYEVLTKVQSKLEEQEKKMEDGDKEDEEDEDKEEFVEKSIVELEIESREEVKETFDEWFERLNKIRRSDRFESYINAIVHVYDPHTDYLNPKEKQDFDIRMGGKLEGIGARLSPEGEYTRVVSIVPGGPAYKAGELEVDDLIMVVTQEDGEPLDIKGMRLDDVVTHIRGDKGTIVTLQIKKASDKSVVDIKIERDEVIIDEGFARSLLLEGDDTDEKIGYIKLPKFYSSFERKGGNSCSEDVKKELEKLKESNVSGVILDLRNNGGGSLRDVVSMTGLFIEDGPIVQVKPRDKKATIYEDTDDGVVYDGPLVVMVNQYSASASEILAAALQDYNRAIIVGSNSTFGKGTVQRFFDLDEAYKGKGPEYSNLGNIKVTMQKFYRVNGGSTQLKGVIPDIVLPDNYHYLDIGEKDYDYAMDWSVIDPVKYEQHVLTYPNIAKLAENSEARIKMHPEFALIMENAKRLKANRDITSYPLSLNDYEEFLDKREKEAEKFKDLMDTEIGNLMIKNLDTDVTYINSDESRVARNEVWIKNVSKDIYVEEVLKIMKDVKLDN